jgi:Skp family chaperone for outer membrane proteins
MNVRISAWVGLILGTMSLLMWTRPVTADDASAGVKIAVCDPIKVLNQIQEGKDAMAKWKEEGDSLTDKATAKKSQLQSEQDALKLILPTSDDYETQVETFIQHQADAQAWLQAAQMNMARKQRTEEKTMFDKILKTISDLAQAQGLSLVVNGAHADFPELDKMDANAFVQTILLHTALYSDTKLDITQQVIIAMDKAYSTSSTSH